MFRRTVVWAAMASAPTVACSLLLGEGYTDPDTTTAGDSGTATESGDATSAFDASNGNGDGGTSDGASEASVGCPPGKVSFCDDFERQDPIGEWANKVVENGGELSLVASPSGAGHRLQASAPAKDARAYLAKKFPLTPTKLHFEVTLEYASLPTTGSVHMLGAGMQNSTESPSIVYVYADTGGVWFVQQVADTSGTLYRRDAISIPAGKPHRLVIDVVFGGSAKVEVDAMKVLDTPTQAYLVPASPEPSLGASQLDSSTAGPFTMYADDFVFTAD